MDKVNFDAWSGRTVTETGGISDAQAQMIAATLNYKNSERLGVATKLPLLWHWFAFPNTVLTEHLGRDGHPKLGEFMPPVRLERRMWAGGALRFHSPLHIGDTIRRRTRIGQITEKEGRSGPMVLMTLHHEIFCDGGLAVEERQDIVYLDIPKQPVAQKKTPMPDRSLSMSRRVETPETLLFRFSAMTFNAHRIHYDKTYAQQVEHYPDLVVHGPLQAMLLMQAATQHAGRMPSDFHFRAIHPMFAGQGLDVVALEQDGALDLYTGQGGHQGMQATALWEGTV